MINDNITSVRDGIADISTQLCGGFAGTTAAVTNAQNAITQQMYANQIADLNRSFDAQVANTAGLTNISAQLANCCCENRAATQDVKYTIATEACANRATSTANTQAILDKLCQLELDGVKAQVDAKNDRILELQNQLNMATLRESQTAQNAFIAQGFSDEVDQLYNRLNNCPVPSTPVYGRTPWFGMKRRCNDPKIPNYKSYGGRGITVCDEWLDFAKFKEWAISTGYDENAPFGQCTIERIDVNGNYEPDNCTWKNMKEQGNNRRTNKLLTYNGKTQSISEWTDEMGYARHIIKNRLRRGWSVERAITTPVGEYKWHQNSK